MHRCLRTLRSLLLVPAVAAAGPPLGLVDPTRPPSAAPAQAAAPSRPAASAPDMPAPPPQLQAVQLARGGASTALVDGRLLRVGDRVGDAKVVAIDLQGLQLQGPRGTERLWLLAAVVQPSPPPLTPAPPTVAVAGER